MQTGDSGQLQRDNDGGNHAPGQLHRDTRARAISLNLAHTWSRTCCRATYNETGHPRAALRCPVSTPECPVTRNSALCQLMRPVCWIRRWGWPGSGLRRAMSCEYAGHRVLLPAQDQRQDRARKSVRAGFTGKPSTCPPPFKKARPAQRGWAGPRSLSPDTEPKLGSLGWQLVSDGAGMCGSP